MLEPMCKASLTKKVTHNVLNTTSSVVTANCSTLDNHIRGNLGERSGHMHTQLSCIKIAGRLCHQASTYQAKFIPARSFVYFMLDGISAAN